MLQEEEEEERALDLQMEIDRLRALEAYEERERQRMAESRVGAQILNEQIVERKQERVHREELRDLVMPPPSCTLQPFPCTPFPPPPPPPVLSTAPRMPQATSTLPCLCTLHNVLHAPPCNPMQPLPPSQPHIKLPAPIASPLQSLCASSPTHPHQNPPNPPPQPPPANARLQ